MSEPLVVRRRAVAVALSALPAAAVALLLAVVRDAPPAHVLLPVVAAVAGQAWVVWRLMAAHVVVGADGLTLHGVTEVCELPWRMLTRVSVDPAPGWVRLLLWGLVDPYVVTLHLDGGLRLRPVALWAPADDRAVAEAVDRMRRRVSFPAAPAARPRSA